MNKPVPNTKIAEDLYTRPEGATRSEILAATGSDQYNVLKRLEGRGYAVRKVKEGNETRYFAEPPAALSFEATVTSKGQVTIPKEVRDKLRVGAGSKVRFTIGSDGRVVVARAELSIQRLFGILGKPARHLTIEEMDEAIARAVAEEYRGSIEE